MAKTFTLIGSPGFERDEAELRELARTSFDRGRSPAAGGRQLAAILASGDRTKRLRGIAAPTLVIHGKADKLVRPSGGRATAKAIERRASCSRSRAWPTTSRAGPGRRSSTRSSRTRLGRSAQRVIHESGRLASVAIGSGRRSSTRSASVTCSSTSRTLVRSAIQTSCSLASR